MRPPYIIRMEQELHELSERIDALTFWIGNNDHFKALAVAEQQDQTDQLAAMRDYKQCLDRRLARFNDAVAQRK